MNGSKKEGAKKIIIYGAGNFGKRLYHFLKSIGCVVDSFCETRCEETKYYDNVKIISLKQLSEMLYDEMIILIAIKNGGISHQIKGQLLDLNYTNIDVYECGDFICQNISDVTWEETFRCNVCGKAIKGFGKSGVSSSKIFDKYHIIGGGSRDSVICPLCGSTDRMRWQYRFLGRHMSRIFSDKCSVLHIAPEFEISTRIQSNTLCDYYPGDIAYGNSMHIVDVTNIQFKEDFFDFIILNHVLEHIEDEEKAITELKRVLKPNGKLILSFPICTDIDTYENPDIQTPEKRLDEYGQMDHVRLYGKDFKTRLEKYGLKVDIFSPQNECSKEEILKYGFIYDDITMLCSCI